MIETVYHKLKKPEITDEIIDTINDIHNNMEMIDNLIDESSVNLQSFLVSGQNYSRGKRLWNLLPVTNGNIGWVNIRNGVFAPTWQERTSYKLGDLVMTQSNNGHIYECIENGTSGVSQPSFPITPNSSVFDFRNANAWIGNYVYNVDDIVLATNGNQLYYYKCTTGGTSSTAEPTWSLTSGTQINDGSAIWQTYKSVKWKEVGTSCDFKEFGKIS